MRISATRKAGGLARSQTAARSAAHSCWICASTSLSYATVGVQFGVPPGSCGIGRDDLHRLVELVAEAGREVGVPVDHGVHRLAQPARVKRAGHGDIQLHRIHSVVGTLRGAGVKQQPLLQRGQRQDVGDPVLLLQLVDLLLGQPGWRDIRGVNPPPPCAHVRADAGEGVKPQPAQPADLRVIDAEGAQVQVACSCGPDPVSTVTALSSTVCIIGMGIAVAAAVTAEPS